MRTETVSAISYGMKARVVKKANGELRKLEHNDSMTELKMQFDNTTIRKCYSSEIYGYYTRYDKIAKITKSPAGTEEIITQKGNLGTANYKSYYVCMTEPNGQIHDAYMLKYYDKDNSLRCIANNPGSIEISNIKYLYTNINKLSRNGKRIINEYVSNFPKVLGKK